MTASSSRKSVNTAADAQKRLRADEHVTELSVQDTKRLEKTLTTPKLSQTAKALAKKYRERAGK